MLNPFVKQRMLRKMSFYFFLDQRGTIINGFIKKKNIISCLAETVIMVISTINKAWNNDYFNSSWNNILFNKKTFKWLFFFVNFVAHFSEKEAFFLFLNFKTHSKRSASNFFWTFFLKKIIHSKLWSNMNEKNKKEPS